LLTCSYLKIGLFPFLCDFISVSVQLIVFFDFALKIDNLVQLCFCQDREPIVFFIKELTVDLAPNVCVCHYLGGGGWVTCSLHW